MKNYILFLIILVPLISLGQESETKSLISNNVYFQVGPYTGPFSINYERRIYSWKRVSLNVHIGCSHNLEFDSQNHNPWIGIPFGGSLVFGSKRGHFETGIQYNKGYYLNPSSMPQPDNSTRELSLKFGFRYQKLQDRGFNFRIGIAPYRFSEWDHDYMPIDIGISYYLSCGYSF